MSDYLETYAPLLILLATFLATFLALFTLILAATRFLQNTRREDYYTMVTETKHFKERDEVVVTKLRERSEGDKFKIDRFRGELHGKEGGELMGDVCEQDDFVDLSGEMDIKGDRI